MLEHEIAELSEQDLRYLVTEIMKSPIKYRAEDIHVIWQNALQRGMDEDFTSALEGLHRGAVNAERVAAAAPPLDTQSILRSQIREALAASGEAVADSFEGTAAVDVAEVRKAAKRGRKQEKQQKQGRGSDAQDAPPPRTQVREVSDASDAWDTARIPAVGVGTGSGARVRPVVQPIQPMPVMGNADEDDYEDEREPYPILRFLSDFYRTLGWLMFAVFLAGFGYAALNFIKDNTPLLIVAFVGAAFVGVILLILFYAKAEGLSLRLQTEQHLRDIKRKL